LAVDVPRVSVLVPVRNGARFLRASLESAVKEVGPRDEIVVSDDASTDGSRELLKEFHGQVTVGHNPVRLGIAQNHNLLLRRARGSYLTFLHQDDELTSGAVDLRVRVLEARPTLGMVAGDSLFVDEWGVPLGPPQTPSLPTVEEVLGTPPDDDERLRLRALTGFVRSNLFQVGSVMLRRNLAEQVGEFWEDLTLAFDYDYWLRSLLVSPVAHIPTPIIKFRRHDGQASHRFYEDRASAQSEMSLAMAHAREEAHRLGVRLPFTVAAEWQAVHLMRRAAARLPPSFFRGLPSPVARAWSSVFGM